ncbi:MAG TPA: DUF58 domain-containing protein [Candidatus Gastranaerophilales bacterium]|nr:DUF58 domain-containing protein [Candidatus Gastranaerophilales bacterium]
MKTKSKIEESFIIAEKILQKIRLKTLRKVENPLQGSYLSFFQGHGLDYKEIREYSINDDIKNIDWNVTARTGKPHVRIYEEERNNTVWLILDVSSSMDFGSALISKKDILVKIIALIGYIADKRRDKTGAILFDDKIKEIIPPEKGLKQIYKIVKKLLEYKPEENNSYETDFSSLENIIGRKNFIFFISDFIFPNLSRKNNFGELVIKNDFQAIQILDPVEETLPSVGYINLYDPETGKNLIFDSSNPAVTAKYQELLNEENEKLNEIFSLLKLKPVKIYTNSDIAEVLINYMNKSRR